MLALAAWLERLNHPRSGGERASPPVEVCVPRAGVRPTGGGGSAFRRALSRGLRYLAPKDGSIEAYRAWCDYEGIHDPDNEWHDEICILAGWPVPSAPTALPMGQPVPQCAAEVGEAWGADAAPDAGEDGLSDIEVEHMPPAVVHAKRVLEPQEIAERFVEWVRLADRCGTYSDRELTDLTAEFVAAEGLAAVSDNVFRPALLTLGPAAVTKSRSDRTEYLGDRRSRRRQYQWTIHADPETSSHAIPWSELPERNRRAA